MFYCDHCAAKNNWPVSLFKTKGNCESCGDNTICNDVATSQLPKPFTSSTKNYSFSEAELIAYTGNVMKLQSIAVFEAMRSGGFINHDLQKEQIEDIEWTPTPNNASEMMEQVLNPDDN